MPPGTSAWSPRSAISEPGGRSGSPGACGNCRTPRCDGDIDGRRAHRRGRHLRRASLAELLAAAGHEVIVADRRRHPLLGSTPASTALIEYEIDTPLTTLSRQIGRDEGDSRLAPRRGSPSTPSRRERANWASPAISRSATISCSPATPSARGRWRARARRDGAPASRRSFSIGARCASASASRGAAALLSFRDLAADPRRIAAGYLARRHRARRARSTRRCHDRRRRREEDRVIATTGDGHRIRCRHLVFATGYELPDAVRSRATNRLDLRAGDTPATRSAVAAAPVLLGGVRPLSLWARHRDGRVICGGEDVECPDEEHARPAAARQDQGHSAEARAAVSAPSTRGPTTSGRARSARPRRAFRPSAASRACAIAGRCSALAATASPTRASPPT